MDYLERGMPAHKERKHMPMNYKGRKIKILNKKRCKRLLQECSNSFLQTFNLELLFKGSLSIYSQDSI